MNKFMKSLKTNQEKKLTENGGITFDSSGQSNVDLFFQIGALRGQEPDRLYRLFSKAYGENKELAIRTMLWVRDVRGGAGERKIFRDLLTWLETNDRDILVDILPAIPELGRWDDLLVFGTKKFKTNAFNMIEQALGEANGLCAKWMPRKGVVANELRNHMKLSPKRYRKLLVELTNVVENQLCAKQWEDVNYEKVPSVAQSRYNRTFLRHDEERYREFSEKAKTYAEAVASGEPIPDDVEKVKINAGAVYPYDVLKSVVNSYFGGYGYGAQDNSFSVDTVRAQWLTLPNYIGNNSVLPMVDVSGSMTSLIGSKNLSALQVALSLGLYMSGKNSGAFHNALLTFTSVPELIHLKGEDIIAHIEQMSKDRWYGSTNVSAAFTKILSFAVKNAVPQEDMPEYIIVFSDMEFDRADRTGGETASEDMEIQFSSAGYRVPKVVWWNIQSRQDNVPVSFNKNGAALVSGFSPSLAKNIMSGESINPTEMMLKVIMDERYDLKKYAAA